VPHLGDPWPEMGWDCSQLEFQRRFGYKHNNCDKHAVGESVRFGKNTRTKLRARASRFSSSVKNGVKSRLKKTGIVALGMLAKRLIRKYSPPSAWPPLMASAVRMEAGDMDGALRMLDKNKYKILSAVVPWVMIKKVIPTITYQNTAVATYQTICENVKTVNPVGSHLSSIVVPEEGQKPNWETYTNPTMTFYMVLGKKQWFKENPKKHGMKCIRHGEEGCQAPKKSDVGVKGLSCIVKVQFQVNFCTSCCCKAGPASTSADLSLFAGDSKTCASWFTMMDMATRMTVGMWRSLWVMRHFSPKCWGNYN